MHLRHQYRFDDGGAILGVDFSVSVTNCVFVGNVATGNEINPSQPVAGYGGAIYDQDGLLTVSDSTFTDNSANGVESNGNYYGGYGGAIAGSGERFHHDQQLHYVE